MDTNEKALIGIVTIGAVAAIANAVASAREQERLRQQIRQLQQQQPSNVLATPPAALPTAAPTPAADPNALPDWVTDSTTPPVVNTAIVDGTVVESAQQALNNIATSQQWPQVSVNGNATDPAFVTELAEFQTYANSNYASALGGTLLPTTGILDAPTLAALFLISGSQGAVVGTPAPTPLPATPPTGAALVVDPALVQTAQVLTNAYVALMPGTSVLPSPTDGNPNDPAFVSALGIVQGYINTQMSTPTASANYQTLTGSAWVPLRTDGVLDGATYAALTLLAQEA